MRRAIALPLAVNASVTIEAAGTPSLSKTIPSATLAALQDPQSPMPVMTTSQSFANSSARSFGTGRAKVGLR
jgi:hypothetical protein